MRPVPLLAVVLAAAVALIVAAPAAAKGPVTLGPPATSCGVERWTVKTLMDAAAKQVNLARAVKATVARLRRLPVSRGVGDARGTGIERRVYEVRARLVAAKLEDDSDVHVVIADPTTRGQMIVELPHPDCALKAPRGAKTRMRNARNAFMRACGVPSGTRFTSLSGTATIRGVGFFDFKHGQRGVAPNGIELHPVIWFRSSDCKSTGASVAGGETEHETTRTATPRPPAPAPEPAPPAAAGSGGGNCQEGYTPCLPIVDDLNCSDIDNSLKPIHVSGRDPYRLDADHDGVGCEK